MVKTCPIIGYFSWSRLWSNISS